MGIGTGWEMWINSRRKRRQTFPTTTTDCCLKRNYIYSLCPMHLWSLCKDTRHIQCPKRLQGWHLPPDQWADKGMEMLLHLCYSSGLCWLPCSDRNTKTTYDGDVYNVGKKIPSMSTWPPKFALTALDIFILIVAHNPIWVVHGCVTVSNRWGTFGSMDSTWYYGNNIWIKVLSPMACRAILWTASPFKVVILQPLPLAEELQFCTASSKVNGPSCGHKLFQLLKKPKKKIQWNFL